ncbi:MAG: MFS transporter [Chloroflexota bacterium]
MRSFLPEALPNLLLGWRWPTALRALRHRNFRLFFFGQLISLSGTWMQTTAQQWLVYRLTGSQLSLGVVTFASFLPVLLLSLFMGVIVDRVPRRRLLVFTQTWFMLCAVALAWLTAAGIIRYSYIIALASLLGLANALDMPARQAFYVDMVERQDLMNAIALNSSVFNGARIIGPALGGVVVAALGEAPAFASNAVSFLAVIAALLLMRLPSTASTPRRATAVSELMQGLHYLAEDRRVLGLVTMVAAFSLIGFPYFTLLPVFASDILRTGASGLGALMAAMGVGALVGALSLAVYGDRSAGQGRGKGWLLEVNRWLFIAALGVFGVSRTPALSMAALVVGGYAFITQLAITNTLIQLLVPDDRRGRVMSIYTWALGGFWPLGALLIGAVGDALGAPNAVLLSASASLALTVLGGLAFAETRRLA